MKKYFFIMLANIAYAACMEQAIRDLNIRKFEELYPTITDTYKNELLNILNAKIVIVNDEIKRSEPDSPLLRKAWSQGICGMLAMGLGFVGATWGFVFINTSEGNEEDLWTGSLTSLLGIYSTVRGIKDMKDARNSLQNAYGNHSELQENYNKLRYMRDLLNSKANAGYQTCSSYGEKPI